MMRPGWRAVLTALVLGLAQVLPTGPTFSQEQRSDRGEARAAARAALEDWNREAQKEGWLGSAVLGNDVLGMGDKPIGKVRNVLVGEDGAIESLIVEPGGTLEGEAPFRIPWQEANAAGNLDRIVTSVDRENLARYSLFGSGPFDVAAMAGSYRLTELVDTYVTLAGQEGYGLVDDVVFSLAGQMKAIIVRPGTGADPRRYALPYDDGFYDRGVGIWKFPFAAEDLAVLSPFQDEAEERKPK